MPDALDLAVSDAYAVLAPPRWTAPLVLASPHSGRRYTPSFIAQSALDMASLRKSEDSFVEEIFADAPTAGAPLLHALFARAYLDANRDPAELDPAMFVDKLPGWAQTNGPRVLAGLGVVAKLVSTGQLIYRDKLQVADALDRIDCCHRPYHAALAALTARCRAQFGVCLLIDCHSMPSLLRPAAGGSGGGARGGSGAGWPCERDGRRQLDIVLGDLHGSACAPYLVDRAESVLVRMGYRVARNAPYAGGYTTRRYGRPKEGRHALQIELNRALYMNEDTYEPSDYLPTLRDHMGLLIADLADLAQRRLIRGER